MIAEMLREAVMPTDEAALAKSAVSLTITSVTWRPRCVAMLAYTRVDALRVLAIVDAFIEHGAAERAVAARRRIGRRDRSPLAPGGQVFGPKSPDPVPEQQRAS